MLEGDTVLRGVLENVTDEVRQRFGVADPVRVVICVVGMGDLEGERKEELHRDTVMERVGVALLVVAAGQRDPVTDLGAALVVAMGVREEDPGLERVLPRDALTVNVAALVLAMGLRVREENLLSVAAWVEAMGLRVREAGRVVAMGLRVREAMFVNEALCVEGRPERDLVILVLLVRVTETQRDLVIVRVGETEGVWL
jgi:hypothetical protein